MRLWVIEAMLAAVLGCGGEAVSDAPEATTTASVDVTITDPEGKISQSATQRLFLFDGECPADEKLAYGEVTSAFRNQAITQLDTPFVVDGLEKKPICFVAIFRQADCAVVAFGATPADLSHHKYITTQVEPVIPPLGACKTGLTCIDGACK